jgi:hypothetical protein
VRAGGATGYPAGTREGRPMSEQSGHDAADTAREMREHEREALERDDDERDRTTDVEDDDTDARGGKPAPPGGAATGELGGGT